MSVFPRLPWWFYDKKLRAKRAVTFGYLKILAWEGNFPIFSTFLIKQYAIFVLMKNSLLFPVFAESKWAQVILLPCQWKYWHRAKNRLRDKTGFGMYNPQNVEKSGFGQSVCVSVCLSVRLSVCLSGRLSVLLSLFPRALTGVRFNRWSWTFRGMFGYMGHCAVPIFEAIREPVYKII